MVSLKKILVRMLSSVPPLGKYIADKNRLQGIIDVQQRHINNLEREKDKNTGRLYDFSDQKPHIRLITNQLDSTGAPRIFIDLIKDFTQKYPDMPLELHTFEPVEKEYLAEVGKLGLRTAVYDRRDIAFEFTPGDVIVLNTVAYDRSLKDSIYQSLEAGIAKKLIWYMHEDWPQIFFDRTERKRLKNLLAKNKLTIFIPAAKALANHQRVYGDDSPNLNLLPYRIKLAEDFYITKTNKDFTKLEFILLGKTGEGIKGHLPVLYAFLAFKQKYYDQNPSAYRDFKLRFIGIEKDYLSLQILNHAVGLDNHFEAYPPLPHAETLSIIRRSNVTICYSMRECLPIFVFEGMAAGHPILRNDVSGMEEQLRNGKNGLLIASNSFYDVVRTLERIINKGFKAADLVVMSKESNEIVKKFKNNSYATLIDETVESFSEHS